MTSLTDLQINVNRVTFDLQPDMYIDIRPEDDLRPVAYARDEQPALIYLISLGESSRKAQWGALVVIAGILSAGECTPITFPWHKLRYQHTNAVRAWLVQNRAPATGRRFLCALRGTLKECWRMGLLGIEDYNRAIDIKPIRGSGKEQAAGRALEPGEKSAILGNLTESTRPADIRNAAIFGLAVYGGLRRAELARLRAEDYDTQTGQLTVFGKGSKERTVYVAPGVDDALADWLHLRGHEPGPLFTHILKSGEVTSRKISPEAVYNVMTSLQQQAGIKEFTPHDLRRTFAGDLLDAGADISVVQRLMGHASATTTASYDRRGERAKKQAMGKLHMPYRRKFEG